MATNVYYNETRPINNSDGSYYMGQGTLNNNYTEMDLSHYIPAFTEEITNSIDMSHHLNLNNSISSCFDLNNELFANMVEHFRDAVDNSILQYISEVHPIDIPASEIFRLNFKYTGFGRKKLELRLPDELFEME